MIESGMINLHDTSRSREVPVKIYHPRGEQKGVILFSHGLGGSCDSYQYFAEFMAANGYKCYHPTHVGIDAALLKEKRPFQALKEAADVTENKTAPALDCKFVMDELGLDNVIMAGHSFGAFTTLMLSGQDISERGFNVTDLKDKRVKCSIVMSPHAVHMKAEQAYSPIDIPMLHITGKFDDSPFGFFEPIQRRIPFDNIAAGNQYLIIFNDADHMVFAAQRRQNKFSAKDITIMKLTCEASLEFIKKYADGSNSALDTPAFADKLAPHALFENK